MPHARDKTRLQCGERKIDLINHDALRRVGDSRAGVARRAELRKGGLLEVGAVSECFFSPARWH